jgi:NADH-quinone oxidoreductase subunit J
MLDNVLFYFFATLAVGAALLVVTRRNPLHSALFLVIALLATGGIFLQLRAEFLIVAQIVLFAAAIPALIIVAVALLRTETPRKVRIAMPSWIAVSIAAALVLEIAGMLFLIRTVPGDGTLILHNVNADKLPPNSEALAQTIFTSYLLPFETAAVVLLVALAGAVILTRTRRSNP